MFVADMVAPNKPTNQEKENERDKKKLISFHIQIMREISGNYVKKSGKPL